MISSYETFFAGIGNVTDDLQLWNVFRGDFESYG